MRKACQLLFITLIIFLLQASLVEAINIPGGGGIGTINPPDTIPTAGANPSGFIAGLVRGFISLLIIVAFILGLVWTIFAGYAFIFAGGDPKKISTAWSRIYWGLLGLTIVLGSFAIIKLAETFFDVQIISTGFQLPTR